MKSSLKITLLLLLPVFVTAQFQQNQLDSMHLVLNNAANDTIRMDAYYKIGFYFDDVNLDSSIYYNEKGISISEQLGLKLNEAEMLMGMSFPLSKMGNYPQALEVLMQASEIARDPSNEKNTWHLLKWQTPHTYRLSQLGYNHLGFGELYSYTGNYEKQIATYFEGKKIAESINDSVLLSFIYMDIGNAYDSLNKLDSALFYFQKALEYFSVLPFEDRKYEAGVISGIGGTYQKMGNLDLAKKNFINAIQVSEKQNNPALSGDAYLQLAYLYQSFKKLDSSLLYIKKALEAFKVVGKEKLQAVAYRMISEFYGQQKNADSSFFYLKLATTLNDSLDRIEKKKLQEYQAAGFTEQLRLQELEKEKLQTQSKIRAYAMLAGIGVFMLIAFLLYRNNRSRKKANELLQKQKEEIEVQKKNVEGTLVELKSTQSQLIQSEKMASLGELTAGIAHEIQNPLNFVNNFSEVNKELIAELNAERLKPNAERNEQLENDILNDIEANEEKINHHGKRADAIVKGMLQHSQSSTGVKEPTNINALADEYLRLAYHGLRAKDNSFNATMKTDFDNAIGKINIVPQDIGRVLLNLYNNAFYAVSERQKAEGVGYEPTISVITKLITPPSGGRWVAITVRDNGNGIPQKAIDKIFQPFFTTKPTGQGTGLGLSLSYDIVKAHGGELKAETKEGEGATFIIQLNIL